MMRKVLPIFALIAVVFCGTTIPFGPYQYFYTDGNIGYQTTVTGNGHTIARFAAILDIFTEDNSDALDRWFYLLFNNQPVIGGGIIDQFSNVNESPRGDHYIITERAPNVYGPFSVDTTLRFDSQGWATILWEITNNNPSQVVTYLNNYGYDELGSDALTVIYLTSDGDRIFESNDDWAITYESILQNDPVVGFSFGRGALSTLQAQSLTQSDRFFWGQNQAFLPSETKNILQVVAVGNHVPNEITIYDLRTMEYRLHSVLSLERNFYNYITADGYRLLGHLTYQQLFNTVNWNFVGAGIAGKLESDSESRVVRLDGSIEQITPEPGVYCLFEDRVAQVNFRLSSSGVVDEVVVFAREHGMSFHASLDLNGQPEFMIDGHSVEIPMSRLDGNLVTESAPFQVPFTHIPLSALGEYHVNSLYFRDIFTVVGGYHPELGGFFNVAVHRRASENRFPGLLNVPHESKLRDVGFSSSLVPDVWFDLSQ